MTVVVTVIVFVMAESSNAFVATLFLAGYIATLQFVSDVRPLTYLWNHPGVGFSAIGIYLLIGVCWATIKWGIFVRDCFEHIQERFRSWLESKRLPLDTKFASLNEMDKKSFDEMLGRDYPIRSGYMTRRGPVFKNHLSDYGRWIGYWPFDLIYTLLDDFVRRLLRNIALGMSKAMQQYSDRFFRPFAD